MKAAEAGGWRRPWRHSSITVRRRPGDSGRQASSSGPLDAATVSGTTATPSGRRPRADRQVVRLEGDADVDPGGGESLVDRRPHGGALAEGDERAPFEIAEAQPLALAEGIVRRHADDERRALA
jgi:hypothetical protein